MSAETIQLQPGTTRTALITLPLCGSWLGLIRCSLATTNADATIHEWLFIYPASDKINYRRTGLSTANNYYNGTLKKDVQIFRWMAQNESLCKITYTSTNVVTFGYETTRLTKPAPFGPVPSAQWNITSATPWTGVGNNLAGSNPTEQAVGQAGQLNGVAYWKPRT